MTTPQDKAQFINDVRDALFAAKIVSYAQGFSLLRAAAEVRLLFNTLPAEVESPLDGN